MPGFLKLILSDPIKNQKSRFGWVTYETQANCADVHKKYNGFKAETFFLHLIPKKKKGTDREIKKGIAHKLSK